MSILTVIDTFARILTIFVALVQKWRHFYFRRNENLLSLSFRRLVSCVIEIVAI